MNKPCPHCQKVIETCTCGIWDCEYYSHLYNECPSVAGDKYRAQRKNSVAKRRLSDFIRTQKELLLKETK